MSSVRFPKFFIAIDNYALEFPDGEDNRPHAVGMSACVGKDGESICLRMFRFRLFQVTLNFRAPV